MLQAKDANKSIQIMSQEIFDAAGLPLPTSTTSEALANQKLSIYAKLSTFSPQQELILSRHMSRLVRELQNLDNMHTLFDYASWINSCSDEILWDGIHLKGQNQQILPELQVWIDNKFPLKGKDLLELGVEPGPDVSKFLNQAKNHFCSQPKPISYQELMEYMKKVV